MARVQHFSHLFPAQYRPQTDRLKGTCCKILSTWDKSICVVLHVYVCAHECLCVSVPVSGCILNAGTVESLCMKPYVTLPLEPSSASTAWTCRTNVPAGWFSRTDVLSRYCWHWEWVRRGGQVGGREDHRSESVKKLRSIRHSIQTVSKSVWEVKCWKDRFKITTVVFYWGTKSVMLKITTGKKVGSLCPASFLFL